MSIPSFCLPYVLIHSLSFGYIFSHSVTCSLTRLHILSRAHSLSLSLTFTLFLPFSFVFDTDIRLCYLHAVTLAVSRKYNA